MLPFLAPNTCNAQEKKKAARRAHNEELLAAKREGRELPPRTTRSLNLCVASLVAHTLLASPHARRRGSLTGPRHLYTLMSAHFSNPCLRGAPFSYALLKWREPAPVCSLSCGFQHCAIALLHWCMQAPPTHGRGRPLSATCGCRHGFYRQDGGKGSKEDSETGGGSPVSGVDHDRPLEKSAVKSAGVCPF